MRPRLGVLLSNLVPTVAPTMPDLVSLAAGLEDAGVDTFVLGEHVAWFDGMVHGDGEVLPRSLMASMPDTLVMLGALAARTSRARFLSTLIAPARHPLVTARSSATLHLLSGARFDLGLAAGWSIAEFDALGIPYEERFARLEETVRACRSMWAEEGPSSFHGDHYDFDAVLPLPFPDGGIPIWLGAGATPFMARRVVSWCDGWITSVASTIDEVERGVELLKKACRAAGRDPATVGVSVQVRGASVEALWDAIVEAWEIGATQVVVPLGRVVRDEREAADVVTELAGRLDS